MSARRVDIFFFHIGFIVLISQAVFVREFLVMFHGSEAALGVFFAAWLFWLGAGAWISSRFSVFGFRGPEAGSRFSVFGFRLPNSGTKTALPESGAQILFGALFVLLPLAGAGELGLLRYARGWTAAPVAQIAPLGKLALSVFLAMIPVGALAGALFPLGCYLRTADAAARKQQNVIGRLYGLESLGSCAGGLIFTFWLVGVLSPLVILILLVLLAALHVALDFLIASPAPSLIPPSSERSEESQPHRKSPRHIFSFSISHFTFYILHWNKCSPPRRLLLACSSALVLLCAISLITGLASRWSRLSQQARFAAMQPGLRLAEEADTRHQNIVIAYRSEQRVLFSNHKIVASFPDARACEQRAAFAMVQRPDARRVLLLGGGMEGLAQELLRYKSVKRVVLVEQDSQLIELIRRHLPEEMRLPLEDTRRFGVVAGDPRRFLLKGEGGHDQADQSDWADRADKTLATTKATSVTGGAGTAGVFDLAWIVPADPSTAWQNRLYTREFLELLRKRLSSRGVVICSATSAENYLGSDVASYGASVFATFRAVFADVMVTPGDVNTFAACTDKGQIASDWKELARRYADIRPQGAQFPPDGFAALLPPDRIAAVRERYERLPASINSDLHPVTYYYNMILWGHFAGSGVSGALKAFERAGFMLLLAPLAIALALYILFRVSGPVFRMSSGQTGAGIPELGTQGGGSEFSLLMPVVVAAIGLFAMALDILLLFLYQSSFGSVYERVGLAVSLFMLGMAGGSLFASKLRIAESGSRITDYGLRIGVRARIWLCTALAAMALLAIALPSAMRVGAAARNQALAEYGFFALFLLAGGISGMAFSLASLVCSSWSGGDGDDAASSASAQELRASSDISRTAGWLDAADNWGGALGALLTGTIMVPLLGVTQTAWLLAAVAVAALLAVLIDALLPIRKRIQSVDPDAMRQSASAWGWLLAWACLSVWAVWLAARPVTPAPLTEFPQNILREISGRERFAFSGKPFGHYLASGTPEKETIFSSVAVAPNASGWGGPIRLLLNMDEKSIRHARILEQNETPSYVGDLQDWLRRQFEGKEYGSGFVLRRPRGSLKDPREIDGISGATVTSRAILDLVNQSAYGAGTRILGRDLDAKQFAVQTWRDALGTAKNVWLAVIFVVLIPAYWRFGARLRTVFIAINLVALGFMANQVFTLPHIARLSTGEVFTLASAPLLLIAGLILLSSLLLGSVFCGYICPFGIFQELLSRMARARAIGSEALGGVYRLRYWLLALGLMGFWIFGAAAFTAFDPMQFFFTGDATKAGWLLVAVIAAGCLRYFRFWCRCFCPVGALISLLNGIAIFDGIARRRRRAAFCPVGMATAREIECIRCNLCVKSGQEPPEPRIARKMAWDFPAFILAATLLAAVLVWSDFRHPRGGVTGLSTPASSLSINQGREMDAQKFERGLKEGTIVEKEAKYYKQAP